MNGHQYAHTTSPEVYCQWPPNNADDQPLWTPTPPFAWEWMSQSVATRSSLSFPTRLSLRSLQNCCTIPFYFAGPRIDTRHYLTPLTVPHSDHIVLPYKCALCSICTYDPHNRRAMQCSAKQYMARQPSESEHHTPREDGFTGSGCLRTPTLSKPTSDACAASHGRKVTGDGLGLRVIPTHM